MFKLFNKKEPKATLIATADSVAGLEDYYKEHKSKLDELEATMKPLRDEQYKAKFVIKQIYAQHSIEINKYGVIDNCYLDSDVFTDLCLFNDAELASLRKWTQRYKELETEIMVLIENYTNDSCKGEE